MEVIEYNFWDNIFLADGKWRKWFIGVLFLSGLVFGVSITDFSQWDQVGFFVTAYLLGVPCVIALADREGQWGNWLGLASNIGEIVINIAFGAIGMAISGIYFGFMHIVGLVRWNSPKHQAEDGKVEISKMQKEQIIFTGIFLVAGLVFMTFFGHLLGFERNFVSVFYWLNIATFVISVTSQFLMIMGKTVSWWGWFSSNFVNFAINFMTGNFWFMFRDVIYQANSIGAIYAWKRAEKLNQGN